MGKASITIAVNAKWNGQQLNNAEKALQRLTTLTAASSKSTQSELAKQGAAWAELGGKIYNMGVKTENVGKMLTKSVTAPIIAVGTYAGKMAIDYDTAMANVRKTTNASDQEIQKLAKSALDLSTKQPVTAEQLLNIEALGAQLGVSNTKLESFAKTVSGLDIATDLNAEQAATDLAQFANITQMSQSQFQNWGSTIVDLGNHLATTESKIADMAMRLAGAGTAANLSQADILGMAGAMSSLGIKSEAGGSAMTRIIQNISKNVANGADVVQEYARVSGMSADEFSKAWKEKPMETIEALVTGLKKTHDSGEDMNVTLEKLGINNIRDSDTMRRLANAGDLLKNSVDRANNAWQQNTALTTEVEQRNRSMASRLQVLKNKVDAVAITVGVPLVNAVISALDAAQPLINTIGDLAQKFADMDTGSQQTVLAIVAVAAAAGPALTALGKLEKGVGNTLTAFGRSQQQISVFNDALNTTDGSQMRTYASAETLASKLGTAGNAAAKAAGGAENYVKAWEGFYTTSKQIPELEDKVAAAVTNTSKAQSNYQDAVKKAASATGDAKTQAHEYAVKMNEQYQAAAKAEDAARKQLDTTTKANDKYKSMVDKWSGSTKETAKVSSELAKANNKTKTSSLDAANALEKQAAEMKKSGSACGILKTSLKGIGTTIKGVAVGLAGMAAQAAVFTLIAAAVGTAVDAYQKWKAQQDLVNGAMRNASDIAKEASKSVGDYGVAYKELEPNVNKGYKALEKTNNKFSENMGKAEEGAVKLKVYTDTMAELAGQCHGNEAKLERLKQAVKGYNDITGQSVSITDDMSGALSSSIGTIKANADAWEYNAKKQAYAAAMSSYLKDQIKAEVEHNKALDAKADAQEKVNKAQEKYDNWLKKNSDFEDQYFNQTGQHSEQYTKLSNNVDDATKKLNKCKDSVKKTGDQVDQAAKNAEYCQKQFEKMSGKADDLVNALNNMDGVPETLQNLGISTDNFAAALANAGVKADTLKNLNINQLATDFNGDVESMIAAIKQYNDTKLITKDGKVLVDDNELKDANGDVVTWNGQELQDKNGQAVAEDQTLVDALGNILIWNSKAKTLEVAYARTKEDGADAVAKKQKFIMENQQAITDYAATAHISAADAASKIQKMVEKNQNKISATEAVAKLRAQDEASATQNKVKNKQDQINNTSATAKLYANDYASGSISRVAERLAALNGSAAYVNVYTTNHSSGYVGSGHQTLLASGGIRRHADGAIRRHATGNIVNNPGAGIPLDIVGEAGAEAIVPLTNRKYSRPFARTIAEQMKQLPGGGISTQTVNTYTINIDGQSLRGNARARELIEALVGELVD